MVGILGISSFSGLGRAMSSDLSGDVWSTDTKSQSVFGGAQAAVTSAARLAYQAVHAVTDAIADAGRLVDETERVHLAGLVANAKRLAEENGYKMILRIADERADSPLAATLIKDRRLEFVDGSLSTKQFDIVTLDQARRSDGSPVRVVPDEDGHFLFGLSEGRVPDILNTDVDQDLVRTTLLTSLDRIDILNEESAMRIAMKLADETGENPDEVFARYRPRLGPWAPENVVDGAANSVGTRLRVKPQLTTAIAEGSGYDMNAFSATGRNNRPHLAMGAYADRNGRVYSTALSEGIVWHEWGHANTDGMRPEYRYPGYIKNGDGNYQLEDIPDFHTRHGRVIEPREMTAGELGTRHFFARALHEWRSDLQARTGAMHDPLIQKKFFEATDGEFRVRKGNPIRELGVRFAEDLGIEHGGIRGKNPAETLPQALELQKGRKSPNPYDFAVVMKRWEEDGIAVLYEQKLLEKAEEAGDIEVIHNPFVIAEALEAASDDFLDLSKWALMHEAMDTGPDFGRYAMLMVQGASDGVVLDNPQPELARALLQSAMKRKLIAAEDTDDGIRVISNTDLSKITPALLSVMGENVPIEERVAILREVSDMHDHHRPLHSLGQ